MSVNKNIKLINFPQLWLFPQNQRTVSWVAVRIQMLLIITFSQALQLEGKRAVKCLGNILHEGPGQIIHKAKNLLCQLNDYDDKRCLPLKHFDFYATVWYVEFEYYYTFSVSLANFTQIQN